MYDIQTVEELSLFCWWGGGGGGRNGSPVENFLGILPIKKGNAKSIYSTLSDWLKKKNTQRCKFVGNGFDGAATVAGKNWSLSMIEECTTCYLNQLLLS